MSEPKPEMLVVSHVAPTPEDRGDRVRIAGFCREAKRRGWVVRFLLYSAPPWHDKNLAAAAAAMRDEWDSVEVVTRPAPACRTLSSARRRAAFSVRYGRAVEAGWAPAIDLCVDDIVDDVVCQAVADTCSRFPIRAVVAEYVFASRTLEHTQPGVARVIDTHDRLTRRNRLLREHGVAATWMSLRPGEEKKGLDRADVVLAIQQTEAEHFRAVTTAAVDTVGHIQPACFLPTARREGRRLRAGLLASSNPINVRSTRLMLEEAARTDLRKGAELVVGGSVCEHLGDLTDGVTLAGRVDEVASFYGGLDLLINPMVAGTGLKIKSIEALAYGLPLLSTRCGTEGLPVNHPLHRLETAEDVARGIGQLACGESSLDDLRDASRACFKAYSHKTEQSLDTFFGRL
ncbi:MAG: glycosyltransferase family 4 protein [Planctomycetota bacterium]